MQEEILASLKADFAVSMKKFLALPQQILDQAWEYGKIPEKMRSEMLEFLEMGINKQISAEISERVKHKKLN